MMSRPHCCLSCCVRCDCAAWRFSISSSLMRICASLGSLLSSRGLPTRLYVYLDRPATDEIFKRRPKYSEALFLGLLLHACNVYHCMPAMSTSPSHASPGHAQPTLTY